MVFSVELYREFQPAKVSLILTRGILTSLFAFACGIQAMALELTSSSYRHRAGNLNSAMVRAVTIDPGNASIQHALGSLGQSEAVTFSGLPNDLTTMAAGVWPVVVGSLPSLDLDGDFSPAFLDADDDNDGLLDSVETDTGVYHSPTDTGSDPILFDSDADGFSDGAEVLAGFDPNDPNSNPNGPQTVPSLSLASRGTLALILALAAIRRVARYTKPSCQSS